MFGLGKKKENIDDILKGLDFDKQITVNHDVGRLSDTLCKRDSYFHSCWTRLKFNRPDLCEEMAEIECFIAGYVKDEEPEKEDEDESEGIIV